MALDHNSKPPMGANMMPKAKKMGRTVFGVRMGLTFVSDCPSTSSVAPEVDSLPCFQSLLSKGSVCTRQPSEAEALGAMAYLGVVCSSASSPGSSHAPPRESNRHARPGSATSWRWSLQSLDVHLGV